MVWFQVITQNQERFVQLLNDPEVGSGSGGSGGVPTQGPNVGGGGGGGGGGSPGEGGYIQVTPEEKQAIERVS